MGPNIDDEFDLNLGYSRPLWEDAALEVGYEGTMEINDIDQIVETFDSVSGQWVVDSLEGSSFHGNQTVHALYLTLAWEWKKFSVLGGLRAEETFVEISNRKTFTLLNWDIHFS